MKLTRCALFLLSLFFLAIAAVCLLVLSGGKAPAQREVPAADPSLTDVISFDLSHQCDTTVTNQRNETLIFQKDDLSHSGTLPVKEENYTTQDVQFYLSASNSYSLSLEGERVCFALTTHFAYLNIEGTGIGAVYLDANGALILTPKQFSKMEYSLSVDFLSEQEEVQTFCGTSRRTVEFDLN